MRNSKLLCALTEKFPYRGYFPDPEKRWHICAKEKEEEEAREYFEAEGLKVQVTRGHQYLGGFCGGQGKMDQWIRHKVHYWAETIYNLRRFAVRYPQTAYIGLAMLIQAE